MTARPLSSLLGELDWTQAHAARLMKVHANTMSRWVRDNNAPHVVYLYLHALANMRRMSCAT